MCILAGDDLLEGMQVAVQAFADETIHPRILLDICAQAVEVIVQFDRDPCIISEPLEIVESDERVDSTKLRNNPAYDCHYFPDHVATCGILLHGIVSCVFDEVLILLHRLESAERTFQQASMPLGLLTDKVRLHLVPKAPWLYPKSALTEILQAKLFDFRPAQASTVCQLEMERALRSLASRKHATDASASLEVTKSCLQDILDSYDVDQVDIELDATCEDKAEHADPVRIDL